MDRKLRKILTECIQDVETGARDIEGCLQRHPDRAVDLRPHLELWRGLNAAAKAQPNSGSQQRGQHQLLAALSDMEERGKKRMIPFLTPALVKAAAVVAGVALLAGGAAGASAAFGGPNVADEVLTTVGITSDHGDGTAADTLETVDENTPDEADFGLDTAQDAVEDGLNIAGEHSADAAGDGLNTADEAGNVPDDVLPGDVPDDVLPDDMPPDGAPPEDVPPDSVPDSAPVPDSVPVAPQP